MSAAFTRVPRDAFLDASEGASQAASIPANAVLTTMLAALELNGTERVLELGSITGFETALLCHLAREVVSLVPSLEQADARGRLLTSLACNNVKVAVGQGTGGWPDLGPYAAILVASGATHAPAALLDQLELGGRLVIPLGDPAGQLLEAVSRRADGYFTETVGSCQLPMLPWASRRPSSFPWRHQP